MKTQCRLRIIQLFVLVAAFALGATPAIATIGDDGVFQIDGDVLHTPTGSGDDWKDLFTCSGNSCGPSAGGSAAVRAWTSDFGTLSIFTGGGSKDQIDISQWQWKDGSVPDKDNL